MPQMGSMAVSGVAPAAETYIVTGVTLRARMPKEVKK
jgi:hypothetical protein